MSSKKLKKEEGQKSLDELFKSAEKRSGNCPTLSAQECIPVNNTTFVSPACNKTKNTGLSSSCPNIKKRTPPSPSSYSKKENKRANLEVKSLQETYLDNMSENQDTDENTKNKSENKKEERGNEIVSDPRFKNFSDEFTAFGQLMCDKLNEIVEPLRDSNRELKNMMQPLQDSITMLTEDKKTMHTAINTCEDIKASQSQINQRCDKMEQENRELRSRLLRLENKLLDNNLIFHGIKEDNWDSQENTKERIWRAISYTVDDNDSRKRMKIARGIQINCTKRIGKYRQGTNRPVSVTFEKKGHVETLFESKKHLPKGVYVDREYTEDIEKTRKLLRPILKLAKTKPLYKGKCKLEDDTLVVLGKRYTISTLHKLPADINGFEATSKNDGTTLGYFGELNPFSNFHRAEFDHDGKHYHSSEQFIQEAKALHFKDEKTAKEIMEAATPLECKMISRDITGFTQDEWKIHAKAKCKPGIAAKFRTHSSLMNLLRSTGTLTIVESTYDDLWGTGIPLKDRNCLDSSKWTSQGIMGEILMEIRSESCTDQMETT